MKRIHVIVLSVVLIALFVGVALSAAEVAKINISITPGQSILQYTKLLNLSIVNSATQVSLDDLFKNQTLVDVNYEIDSAAANMHWTKTDVTGIKHIVLVKGIVADSDHIALNDNGMIKKNSAVSLASPDNLGDLSTASELYFDYLPKTYLSVNYKGYELARVTAFEAYANNGKTGESAVIKFKYGSNYYNAQLVSYSCSEDNVAKICYNIFSIAPDSKPGTSGDYAPLSRNNFTDGAKLFAFLDNTTAYPKTIQFSDGMGKGLKAELTRKMDTGVVHIYINLTLAGKAVECYKDVISSDNKSWSVGEKHMVDIFKGGISNTFYCKGENGEEVIVDYVQEGVFDVEQTFSFRSNFFDSSCNGRKAVFNDNANEIFSIDNCSKLVTK